jgi:Zn-dependent peptidase ImmA (M78 family)
MNDELYRVYMLPFPGDIKAAVRIDAEGYPSIYINDALSPAAKKQAFLHELRHIERDDHYNDLTIEEAEADDNIDLPARPHDRARQPAHLEDPPS